MKLLVDKVRPLYRWFDSSNFILSQEFKKINKFC
uniref:Uncharacterized protein n=1 Tax=Ackermannviridae sp. TaxID=2831612 RepID=A0A8S5VPH8_9CAUD|nr:MAG TPA: hypothetical protein [Ackermannviridae sp.]